MPTSPLLRRNQPATLALPSGSDPAIIRAARSVAADLTAAVGRTGRGGANDGREPGDPGRRSSRRTG